MITFKFNIPFSIGIILLIAFCVRFFVVATMFVLDIGQQTWTDESTFYNEAVAYLAISLGTATQAQMDGIDIVSNSREFSISYVMHFVMDFFGSSLFVPRVICVFFGVGSVFLVYRITYIITNSYSSAKLSALIASLFPALIIYSTMFTREPFIVFFILFGFLLLFLHNAKVSFKYRSFVYLIPYLGCIYIENHLHGAVALVMSIMGLVYVSRFYSKKYLKLLPLLFIMGIGIFSVDFTYLNTIGDFNLGFLYQEIEKRATGTFAYVGEVDSISSFLNIFPSLIFHFTVGFPVKTSLNAIILIANSLIWLTLFVTIYMVLPKLLVRSSEIRLISFAILLFIIIFAVGSANYGTSMRHKTKFAPLLIILAVSTIAFRQKKYLYNL